MPVDPNEPTYCLCQQVSYGEMIGWEIFLHLKLMLDYQFPLPIGATTRTVLLNGSTLAAWTWATSQRGSGIAPSACPCSRRRKCSRSKNEESPIMATMFFSLSFHKFAVEVFLACDYQPFLGNYHLNVDLFEVSQFQFYRLWWIPCLLPTNPTYISDESVKHAFILVQIKFSH